jgi:hypothetical protein
MSKMFITAINGPSKLKLGYPVMSDKYDSIGFVLDPTTPAEILLGTALMVGAVQGTYKPVKDGYEVITADNVNKVVGFALGSNVIVPRVFPADGPDKIYPGDSGSCLIQGGITVRLSAETDPAEEDKVYIVTASTDAGYAVGDITDGATVANVPKVQLPNWRFMGITDTDEGYKVTAIHKGF